MDKGKKGDATLTPQICNDFPGSTGDSINWQGLPATCTISQNGSANPYPFTPFQLDANGLAFTNLPLPIPTNMMRIAAGSGKHTYIVQCCPSDQQTHTVTVS